MSSEERAQRDLDHFIQVEVRELIQLMERNEIVELAVQLGPTSVRLRRGAERAPQEECAPAPQALPAKLRFEEPVAESKTHVVTAPMVGTYYLAAHPGARPLVTEGQVVEQGQTVGVIEAMKIMNDVESTVSGCVTRVLVADGQAVEYGQPLLVVRPA